MQTIFSSVKINTLLILLLFVNFLFAQKEKSGRTAWKQVDVLRIDSLNNVLQTQKDTTRVNTLNELANAYRGLKTDTIIIIAGQAYREADKLNHKSGMARATLITMWAYLNLGNQIKVEEAGVYAAEDADFTLRLVAPKA